MFKNEYGWLHYTPTSRYILPEICRVAGADAVMDPHGSRKAFKRRLYYLHWPGQMFGGRTASHPSQADGESVKLDSKSIVVEGEFLTDQQDSACVPAIFVYNWKRLKEDPNAEPDEKVRKHLDDPEHSDAFLTDWLLESLFRRELLPDAEHMPTQIAYHLAINSDHYGGVHYPVAGVPIKYIKQVVNAAFVLDSNALAALQYLKWLAESHWKHPMLTHFDTAVRDQLLDVAITPTEQFFKLLFDYQYDFRTRWYARMEKAVNERIAFYLHWVGQGRGGMDNWRRRSDLHDEGMLAKRNLLGESVADLFQSLDAFDYGKTMPYCHQEMINPAERLVLDEGASDELLEQSKINEETKSE